jgi:hypothetical protein
MQLNTICGIAADKFAWPPSVEEIAVMFSKLNLHDMADFFLLAEEAVRYTGGYERSKVLWVEIGHQLMHPKDGTEGGCPMVEEIYEFMYPKTKEVK